MNRSLFQRLLIVIPLILMFLVVIIAYLYYISGRSIHTRPILVITDTYPQDEAVIAGQSVIIFGRAEDPQGMSKVELWVNGQKVGVQINPDQEYAGAWNTASAFIPDDPGDYLIFLRGQDREGMIGQSEPILVTVYERLTEADPDAASQYILQDGETIEDVASQFGLDPAEIRDRNPGSDDGSSLILPGNFGGVGESSSEDDSIPHVSEPPPPPPPGGETAAVPTDPLLAGDDVFWVRIFCLTRPDFCRSVMGRIEPPAAPDQVAAVSGDLCQAVITWRDNSEDEVGFLVYLITIRPRLRMELVETVSSSPGSGTRLQFTDSRVPLGEHLYSVRAFNEAGETWGAPSGRITSDCPAIEPVDPEIATIGVEALSFSTPESYDRLYCYVSLADASFERVPASPTEFIDFEGGEWNIAAHLGGRNTRTLQVNRDLPLHLDVSCLGWQGGRLIELGRFQRDHPSIEWDGHPITDGPSGGGFSVTYRIYLTIGAYDEEHSIWMPIIDPTVPAPFNLRHGVFDFTRSCSDVPGTHDYGCVQVGQRLGIGWDYRTDPSNPRPPTRFRVTARYEHESESRVYYSTPNGSERYAPPFDDCSHTIIYQVFAVVGTDSTTGDEIISPLSEPLTVPSTCQALVITIDSFVSDRSASAYGWFNFNGRNVRWNRNFPCGFGSGCLLGGSGPLVTIMQPGGSINGSDMFLRGPSDSYFRFNNAQFRIPLHPGEPLRITASIYNNQDILDDDLWCSGGQMVLPGMSLEEWTRFVPRVTVAEFGNCRMNVIVEPVP